MGWRSCIEIDVAAVLKPGVNQIALSATNASDGPNPAGAIGLLDIEFEHGAPLTVCLDETWKADRDEEPGWQAADFDDTAWPTAKVVTSYGGGPWGDIAVGRFTLSPVEADPFVGHCQLPDDVDLTKVRVYLEMDELAPERAARVTVNGVDAGGFISAPLRLDVTRHLNPGRNTIRIEPFAPPIARLAIHQP